MSSNDKSVMSGIEASSDVQSDEKQTYKPDPKIEMELAKFRKLCDLAASENTQKPNRSWTQQQKKRLLDLTFETFALSIVIGILSYVFATTWYILLTSATVLYTLPTTATSSIKEITARSPFLFEIKYGSDAFVYYAYGTLLLVAGALCSLTAMNAPPKSRFCRYLLSSIIYLFSTFFMIIGPLIPLMAGNSGNEKKLLENDPNYAYHLGIKGSIRYFQKNQCDIIQTIVSGREDKDATQMKAFCKLLTFVTVTFYVMWALVIVPVMGFIICWLQIAVNRTTWKMMTVPKLKPPKNDKNSEKRSNHSYLRD